ncbi:MAG: DNA polymerase IV [Pseudomonadota bacterium]
MSESAERWILHADMDAFYASVEQRDFPELKDVALVVGGDGGRGVVAAASYNARRFGIRSAMPMREAHARCADLVVRRPRMAVYQRESARVFDIFRSFTPVVEGLSLDEAFLDVSQSLALFGTAEAIARELKRSVKNATALTISVGVAPNKLVAKIASDLDKPDGLTVVTPATMQATLDPLSARVLPGIGPRTGARLTRQGIATLRDLRLASEPTLSQLFGRHADSIRRRASGIDDRDVVVRRAEKSISAECTFDKDLDARVEIDAELVRLVEKVAARLRRKRLEARKVTVKIREHDFTTVTRQMPLKPPSDVTESILHAAQQLTARWLAENPSARIRLLGVGVGQLVEARQVDLFGASTEHAGSELDATVDRVTERFGAGALTRASAINRSKSRD